MVRTATPYFVDQLLTQQPVPPALEAPAVLSTQAIFTVLFDRQLREKVGPAAYQQATGVLRQYYRAVELCRQRRLPTAHTQLQQADAQLTALPTPVQDFVTLFHLSAWGNYHYQADDPAQGIVLLRRGLALSAELERQGYALIYRRVEQLLNIGALYARQQRHARAHELLRNTITFVHTGQAQGLLLDDWDAAALQRVRAYQEYTLDEAFARLATQNTALLAHPAYADDYHYAFFFRDLLRQLHADTYNRTILHNWLYVKASYYEDGPAAFLANTLTFVADAEIAPEYGVFKANLLAQASHHLRQHGESPARLASIRAFAATTLLDRKGRAIQLAA